MSSDIWISARQDRAPNPGRDATLALMNSMDPASGCYSFCLNDAKNTLAQLRESRPDREEAESVDRFIVHMERVYAENRFHPDGTILVQIA